MELVRAGQSSAICVVDQLITDDDMPAFSGLPQLSVLQLDNTSLTDRGVEVLENLPNLKHLHLSVPPLRIEGWPRSHAWNISEC